MFDRIALQETGDFLFRQHYTVAVAESVTAGLLQTAFAAAENATSFFQGGITAYNAKQKYTHLQVNILDAISCNCVSQAVASEMALGVSKSFLSDWGIGVTGYSSALPGHKMSKLYAYFAIGFHNEIVEADKLISEIEDPLQVQLKYVNTILNTFMKHLRSMAC